jgi:hypothetical protein
MLPYIEQDNVYKTYQKEPTKVPDTMLIKTFVAPLDPTNSGKTALTSYASNANVFGVDVGFATTRLPAAFRVKGTSNTILFMERYAKVGDKGSHYWYDTGATRTYLYPHVKGKIAWTSIVDPQFAPLAKGDKVSDDTAHGFQRRVLFVGLADGSVRAVDDSVTKTFKVKGIDPDPTTWQWACNILGGLNEAPPPPGW